MAYKTIFTVMTEDDTAMGVLPRAITLARDQDAHLEVMCLGIDHSRANYYEVGASAILVQDSIAETNAKAEAIRTKVAANLEKTGLRWNAVSTVAPVTDPARKVSAEARFADLAVVTLPYGPSCSPDDPTVLESLLFDANCPVVIVPPNTNSISADRIVIGWNESNEALRAVRAALPLLKKAKAVHIAIIDPPEHGPDRSDPGGALAVFLSRHDIASDIQVMSRSGGRVSERLARHVTETNSDMLIMGGYGHSRFREAVLGGATREMLEHAQVPVFMAH